MQVPQQQMRSNRFLSDLHQRLYNMRDKRMHQAPSVKRTNPQRPYNRVREACGQRIRKYGPISKSLSKKDGHGFFHPRKKVTLKIVQHHLWSHWQIQVWNCNSPPIRKEGRLTVDRIKIFRSVMQWHCECATQTDKMHEFWGRALRAHS
jgi:hypothetical protein